jgi:hypothetical protein
VIDRVKSLNRTQIYVDENCFPQNGVANVGVFEICLPEVGSAEICVAKVGMAEVSTTEISSTKIGVTQASITEIGIAKTNRTQYGAAKICSTQVRPAEVGSDTLSFRKFCFPKVGLYLWMPLSTYSKLLCLVQVLQHALGPPYCFSSYPSMCAM